MNLIFVGGGGFFNEALEYIMRDIESGRLDDIVIKGVLDDKYLEKTPIDYLGAIEKYCITDGDRFLISIGNPLIRAKVYKKLSEKGGKFYTYIHPSSYLSPSAKLGEGVIICPNCIVNSYAEVGENVAINVFSSIGHDSCVGKHAVLSPYVSLSGGSKVGEESFLATRSTMFPNSELGAKCTVDAHSIVKGKVDDKHIVSNRGKYSLVKNRLV